MNFSLSFYYTKVLIFLKKSFNDLTKSFVKSCFFTELGGHLQTLPHTIFLILKLSSLDNLLDLYDIVHFSDIIKCSKLNFFKEREA